MLLTWCFGLSLNEIYLFIKKKKKKCNGWSVFLYNFHYEFAFHYRDMMILGWMFNMESIRWFKKKRNQKNKNKNRKKKFKYS
jgi:hypothetical protein